MKFLIWGRDVWYDSMFLYIRYQQTEYPHRQTIMIPKKTEMDQLPHPAAVWAVVYFHSRHQTLGRDQGGGGAWEGRGGAGEGFGRGGT